MPIIPKPEVIGDPACPLWLRWTLIPWGKRGEKHEAKDQRFKLMVHHFLPNADERHSHDHPRSFWTVILRGGYDDMMLCPNEACENGTVRGGGIHTYGWQDEHVTTFSTVNTCPTCEGSGVILRERMRAPMVRYRHATHTHRTRVHSDGAWTIVIMGPIVRKWGFFIDKEWWMYWKDYDKKFGYGMRCK